MSSALVIGGLLAAIVVYLRTFAAGLRPLGPDLFGYIWQTRVVGHSPLSAIEARPGVPVLGSVLAGLGTTSDTSAALIAASVMILALGFAVAAALRLAFRLPLWTAGFLGALISLWGGSVHLAQGHLANLLSVVCIVPALVLLTVPGRSYGTRMLGATAMATASGLAHAGFLPFYGVVAGLWLLLSIPELVRARRSDESWWQHPSCSLALVLLASTAITAVVIFGILGTSLEDFTNIDEGLTDFSKRLAGAKRSVGLWLSVSSVLALAGAVVAWRLARPSSRPLTLLGIAWIVVSGLGWLAATLRPTFPGHRALGMILPLAALTGLGIVGVALVVGARNPEGGGWRTGVSLLRIAAASALVVVLGLLVVSPGLDRVDRRSRKQKGEITRTIASYVAAVRPEVPVVVFTDPARQLAALAWRGRQNQIRALAPTGSIREIFVLVGRLGPDGLPEPSVAPEHAGDPAFTYAVSRSWATGGDAVRGPSVILAPRPYVRSPVWEAIASRPERLVGQDLAILRGPRVEGPITLVPEAAVPHAAARIQVLGGAILLGLIGAATVVLVGVTLALAGADPAGPVGVIALVVVAAVGYLGAWRGASGRTGRHVDPSSGRAPDGEPMDASP